MLRPILGVACAVLLVACSDESEICDDGKDNDNNELVDCADGSCAGSPCGPNGLACAADGSCSACSGNGGLAESAEATCGDAADNDCDGRVDCDDVDCRPQGTTPGRVCDVAGHTCSAPDALGRSVCGEGGGGSTAPTLGTIRLAGADYQVLGARGSGWQEQSLLTFELRTADGRPFPAGLRVAFSHVSQGDSFIGMTPQCSASSPAICTAEATTDAEGLVRVLLTSGRRFAVLSVRAEATAGGVTRHLVAGDFTVVGAKPNGAHFAVDCRPYNVPAFTVHDCLYSRYAGTDHEPECTATLGDRHGNLVAIPTLVSFLSEAGEIAPAQLTPEFDPAISNPLLGQAIGLLEVYGAPLPWDVDPFLIEPSHALPDLDFCGPRTTNPRDGLVSVIALVQGEEGFVDRNLNATFDPGEPFIDLGEPFLDVDDDNVRDDFEWYMDVNEDGLYSGPNGRWDESTVLWTPARLLYTGYPARATDGLGNEVFSRIYTDGTPPSPTPPAPPFIVHFGPPATTAFYNVFLTDARFNPMRLEHDIAALTGNVSAALSPPTHTADSLATTFTLQYCDQPSRDGNCQDGPADQACSTSPCYLVPKVGEAFLSGNYALASITCQEVGSDVVQIHATVEGVTTLFPIAGACLP